MTTGAANAVIADRLKLAPGTVRKHLDKVYGKLGVHGARPPDRVRTGYFRAVTARHFERAKIRKTAYLPVHPGRVVFTAKERRALLGPGQGPQLTVSPPTGLP